MKRCLAVAQMAAIACLLTACGDDAPEPRQERAQGDHIWRAQTDALHTAKDVAAGVGEQQSRMEDKINRMRDR